MRLIIPSTLIAHNVTAMGAIELNIVSNDSQGLSEHFKSTWMKIGPVVREIQMKE